MSGKKEKKKSFKDILRNSFPVDMDGLLREQAEEESSHEPPPSAQIESDPDEEIAANTVPTQGTVASLGTVPTQGTVSTRGTVPLQGTVSPESTVSKIETVPSLGTVPPVDTVPKKDTDPRFDDVPAQPRVEITSNYFLMDADVFDVLAREQDPYEQVIYGYLYRQSYGRNRQMCFAGLKSIVETCQISKNSVRRTLARLEQKKHIKVVERINRQNMKGTVYRVFLPCEISGLSSYTTFKKQK